LNDEHNLIIAGLDYIAKANVHFMPNVIIKSYTASDKEIDITGKITMYLKFDSGKLIP